MRTLYWNGASDVQITKHNHKKSVRIGIASISNVFSARKEGDLRIIKMAHGHNVGVTEEEWQRFMELHDSEQQRNLIAMMAIKPL